MDSESWWRFIRLCLKTKDPKRLGELLELFLTIEERELIALRYDIVNELIKGKMTQREIAEKHHISISKITRGSNALKIISNPLREFLTKSL